MAPENLITKTVELPTEVTLPYVEQGDPSGVPVVFVHAVGDSFRIFEPLLAHLPPSIHAVAPTQRGHGDASRPESGYGVSDFASDLLAFLDALALKTATIVGGSSGGFAARQVAIDHPERTEGLVFLGSPLTLRNKLGADEILASLSTLRDPVDPAFVRSFIEATLVRPIPDHVVESLMIEGMKVPARVWRATTEALLADDSWDRLDEVRAPTLIIWGDQDSFLPRSDQEALAAAIPDSRLLTYAGAGHAFYLEEPARVAADLVRFINGVRQKR